MAYSKSSLLVKQLVVSIALIALLITSYAPAQGQNIEKPPDVTLSEHLDIYVSVIDPTMVKDVFGKRVAQQFVAIQVTISNKNPNYQFPPRAFVFGGKAAPGYFLAKRIIKLINAVGETVNNDPDVNRFLKVAFVPNFNVQNAHLIYPAADLSEQISTAGKEASGTGNMKFAMNGALTIGTLDGANVEIRDAVGAENFFLFGMTVEDIQRRLAQGYRPYDHYQSDDELRAVVDAIADGAFSNGDRELFKPIVDNLLGPDPYMLLADYRSYVECQEEVGRAWSDPERWTRSSILNVARMGWFSSDRSIREYCRDIWHIEPVPIPD